MSELGRFEAGFIEFRKMLAAVPDAAARAVIFSNAASEAARYVSKGLSRADAADELYAIANDYGLGNGSDDLVQSIIAEAFERIEEEDRVPDDIGLLQANGKDQRSDGFLDTCDVGDELMGLDPREWFLGNVFCRQYISSVVAAGGTGKSALRLLQFMSIASGKPLSGEFIFKRSRVLLISLEDDKNEINRRIKAVLLWYARAPHFLKREDLAGYLYFATPKQLAKLAMLDSRRARVYGVLEKQIREAIKRLKIDLVSLDPFVKTHGLEENSSGDMDFVCDLLARIAVEENVAVDSPHHVHKGTIEPGNADAGRGSSGIRDAARLVFTLVSMTEEEAQEFNVPLDQRRYYVRFDPAKINIAAPPQRATWFKLESQPINNGNATYPNGDTVQVAVPWKPQTPFDDIETPIINRILDEIAAGFDDGARRYSSAPAAKDRAVYPVIQKYVSEKNDTQCRRIINS